MTEAQWQDAATLRLRALDRKIVFYADRQGEPGSINRVMLGMARGERDLLATSLLKSQGAREG